MPATRVSRRMFLTAAGLVASGAVSAACGATAMPTAAPPTAAPAEPTATEAAAQAEPTATQIAAEGEPTATASAAQTVSKYEEAPSLAARVDAGELPPVEERLPAEPMVIEPIEELGQWCEDIHRANTTIGDVWDWSTQTKESLTRWDFRSGTLQAIPNIASSYDVEDGGATYVFHLRKGMKWSDGEPFTADDIMFWYEDIALNPDLTPKFPGWLTVADQPAVFEKVDDYTFKIKFAQPYGLLIDFMCFQGAALIAPKHYLKQFHPNYVDKADLEKMAKDGSFDTWMALFSNKNQGWTNIDLPTVWPWILETPPDQGRLIAVRNPYYWKVDTAGKQLPYFERFICELVQEGQAVLMKVIAGEVDYQYRHIGFTDYTLLKENEEKGNYTVRQWMGGPIPCVYVNQSVTDLGLREVFQKKEFRHALSYALNRDEMNDLFWSGLATPLNPVINSRDPYYKEGYGTTAIEYDVDKANELLDAAGLSERDADGFRLRPDGTKLALLLECYPSELGAPAIDIFEQMAGYWKAVGIDAQAKEIERSLWSQRALANELEMPSYDGQMFLWVVDPGVQVPTGTSYWSMGFTSGAEPMPEDLQQLVDWYEALKVEPDAAKRIELGQKILDWDNEMVYVVGSCYVGIQPMIVKNDMVNVLQQPPAEFQSGHESISWPFQMWRRPA